MTSGVNLYADNFRNFVALEPLSRNECGKAMTLSIAPNKFTQSDFTVFYTAPDGRKLPIGRISRTRLRKKRNLKGARFVAGAGVVVACLFIALAIEAI